MLGPDLPFGVVLGDQDPLLFVPGVFIVPRQTSIYVRILSSTWPCRTKDGPPYWLPPPGPADRTKDCPVSGFIFSYQVHPGPSQYFCPVRSLSWYGSGLSHSIHWFTPQLAATAGAALIRSQGQELLPGLPRRCRSPRTWAIFYYFPRP